MDMGYRVEARSYPDFVKEVETLPTIGDVDGMECPRCGGRLYLVDQDIDEAYTERGFELTETFYCDDCCTFAKVTQVYEPTVRRVAVMQDVFENEASA